MWIEENTTREQRGRIVPRVFFGTLALIILLTFSAKLWTDYQAGELLQRVPEEWVAPDGQVYDHTGRGVCAEEERGVRRLNNDLGDGQVLAVYEDAEATCYSGFRLGAGGRMIYMVVEAERVQAR